MQFGRYELCEKMGSGGMGEVFRARIRGVEGFEKHFALKRIFHHLSRDETYRRLFVREAKITARLEHPNIVQVHDLGEIDGQLYIAMALVNGPHFGEIIRGFAREGQRVPPEVAAVVAFDVLEALDFAHHYVEDEETLVQIVHRDVSPENILIERRSGLAKLCDFGVVQATGLTMDHLRNRLVGKVRYMAPEQARTEAIDARVDLYSLGAVLFHALSGRPVLAGAESMEALLIVQRGPLPRLADVAPDAPAELARIVDRAMAFSAADRYQSAVEFRDDIEAYLYDRDPRGARAELRNLIAQVSETVRHDISGEKLVADSTVPATRLHSATWDDTVPETRLREVVPETRDADRTEGGTQRWNRLVEATRLRRPRDDTVPFKRQPSVPGPVPPTTEEPVDTATATLQRRETAPPTVPAAVVAPPAVPQAERPLAIAIASIGLVIFVLAIAALAWQAGRSGAPSPLPQPPATAANTGAPIPVAPEPVAPEPVAREPVGAGPVEAEPAETESGEPGDATAEAPDDKAANDKTRRKRFGYLTLSARPWAHVTIDGVAVRKPTPLRKHPLTPGAHRVVLTGPEGNSMSFIVTIRPGKVTTKRVSFR